jgi:hypothetical protein
MNGFEKIEERMRRHQAFPRVTDESNRSIQTTLSRLNQKDAKRVAFVPGLVAQGSRSVSKISKSNSKLQDIRTSNQSEVTELEFDNLNEIERYFEKSEETLNLVVSGQDELENTSHEERSSVVMLDVSFIDQESDNNHLKAKSASDSPDLSKNLELNVGKLDQFKNFRRAKNSDTLDNLQRSEAVISNPLDGSESKYFVNSEDNTKNDKPISSQQETRYRNKIDSENKFEEFFYSFDTEKIQLDSEKSYSTENELESSDVSEISFLYTPNLSVEGEEKAKPFSLIRSD